MVKVINIDTKKRTIHVSNADGDIKTWRTTESGTHFPIKEGESTKEALDKFVEKKQPESKKEKTNSWTMGDGTKIEIKGDWVIKTDKNGQKSRISKKEWESLDDYGDAESGPMTREPSWQPVKKEPERNWQRGRDEDEDAYFDRREKTLAEARKLDKVSDWYAKAYKGDNVGKPKNKDLTFKELADGLLSGKIDDFYEAVGTGESDVREKIFQELSERTGRPYDDFYDAWLHGGQKGTPARKAKAIEDYKRYNKMLDQPLSPDIKKLVLAARDRAKAEAGEIEETSEEIAHRLTRDYPESFGYDD